MARRRQRRKREKEQRRAPSSVTPPIAADGHVGGPVERLVYSREQAAQALGISLATLDRRVVPAIAMVKTEWGARLIRVAELERLPRRTNGGAAGGGTTSRVFWPQIEAPVRDRRPDPPRARPRREPRRHRPQTQP